MDEESENPDNRNLAVIVPQLPVINPKEIALLVAVDRKIDNVFYVEILQRVWISEISNPETIQGLKPKFLTADRDSLSWGELLSAEEYWCVDGVEEEATPPTIDPDKDDDDRISKTPSRRRWSWLSAKRRTHG